MPPFTKTERLCSKVLIEKLFKTGRSFHCPPFKIVWLQVSESVAPAQLVISVPKRLFKKAVDRNRIKRMTREAYRNYKQQLYNAIDEKNVHLMITYTAKTIVDYKETEEKIKSGLQRLIIEINQK